MLRAINGAAGRHEVAQRPRYLELDLPPLRRRPLLLGEAAAAAAVASSAQNQPPASRQVPWPLLLHRAKSLHHALWLLTPSPTVTEHGTRQVPQVPDGCAKSPARPVFVKFDYTAMTSELDRKRQVPHRQDHTDARTTTGPERLLHGYAKFCFEHVRLHDDPPRSRERLLPLPPPPCTTTSSTDAVYNYFHDVP